MEASKMNFLVAVMVAMLMIAISGVSAADAPAPSPASDATTLFVPTAFASLIALAFGFLF
ncbi:arabinogalactan protein 13-like [Trifolium pratense]|uniref:arabinogalactan protein 13-like n=1 Tax=Trifolium pratense TaxID=57577 RepID=UPI001E6968A3|nr:arabinogalactan protein 13-like [Trifolium pratense]